MRSEASAGMAVGPGLPLRGSIDSIHLSKLAFLKRGEASSRGAGGGWWRSGLPSSMTVRPVLPPTSHVALCVTSYLILSEVIESNMEQGRFQIDRHARL